MMMGFKSIPSNRVAFQRVSILQFLALGVFLAASAQAADWPHWRGPDRDGVSKEKALSFDWNESAPKVLWKAGVGTGFSSIAVADGNVFTMGNDEDMDVVHCRDAESGNPIWSHAYECPLDPNLFEGGPTSTPTVDGDRVHTLSRLGHLHCFDKASGRILWSRVLTEDTEIPAPGWGYASSPVVHGDMLLLNVGEAGMALDKLTGKTIWASEPEEAGYTTPVLCRHGGRDLGIFSSGKYFSAVDLANGRVVWSHRWLTRYGMNACDPVAHDGRVFITSGYGKGATLLKHAIDEPGEVWKEKVLRSQLSAPIRIGEFVYGIDGDENAREPALKCIEFMTGREVWADTTVGFGSLIAADDKLIILNATGELIAGGASPKGWKEIARLKVLEGKCWTPPALANGRLYCRDADGELVCLDLRKP